jgi:hypothetical protein
MSKRQSAWGELPAEAIDRFKEALVRSLEGIIDPKGMVRTYARLMKSASPLALR